MLLPQIEGNSEVEVKERMFERGMTRGQNRQAMVEEAAGEYINFVDDDDLVAADYVSSILPLLDGVDYIGFQVQLYYGGPERGIKDKPTFHSLKYPQWFDTPEGWYRDISHLNPIRRDLALQVKIEGDGNEDVIFADRMRNLGIVKTEHYVDKVMYHYYCRQGHTD